MTTTLDKARVFRCEALRCKLTTSACAARYKLANATVRNGQVDGAEKNRSFEQVRDASELRSSPCRGCEIGKANAKRRG